MQIQDQPLDNKQSQPSTAQKPAPRRGFTQVGAAIGVLLIIGLTIGLLVWRRADQQPSMANTDHGTTRGAWTLVLQGYSIQSLVAAPGQPSTLYACASKPAPQAPGVVTSLPHFALLRSSDGGMHWQQLNTQMQLVNQCQLAVSPTNSNDLYLISQNTSAAASANLFYSNDGGQHWATITPTLIINGQISKTPWNVHQLSIVGSTLFGIQPTQGVLNPPPGQTWPSRLYTQMRLVKSSDGGQNWTIVDGYFNQDTLGVTDYAVDPHNSQIIYEVVSTPYWLIGPVQRPTEGKIVRGTLLYKSADGGATWQQLLSNLPFGSKVQLASNRPSIVYAGGSIGPIPLVAGGTAQTPPTVNGNFNVQVSQDGGASWQYISRPTHLISVQNWFVGPNGTLYVSSGYTQFGTAVVTQGTATLVGTVIVPQGTASGTSTGPQNTTGNTRSITNSGAGAQVPTDGQPTPAPTPATAPMIERYDLASGRWSALPQAPAYGTLIAVTPATQGHDVLWVQVMNNKYAALYRYV
jgi:hypothetical protein